MVIFAVRCKGNSKSFYSRHAREYYCISCKNLKNSGPRPRGLPTRCLKNEQECFIGFKTTRRSRVVLNPIKYGFKHIPGKACVNRVFLAYEKITAYERGVFYYLIKHRILIRRRFIDIKSLHVMYYRPFDRSMGL